MRQGYHLHALLDLAQAAAVDAQVGACHGVKLLQSKDFIGRDGYARPADPTPGRVQCVASYWAVLMGAGTGERPHTAPAATDPGLKMLWLRSTSLPQDQTPPTPGLLGSARQPRRAQIETFAMPPTPQTPIPVTTNMRRVRAMAACLLLQLLLGLIFTALGLPEPWLLAAQWVMGLVLASMALALCLLPLLWLFS